MKIAFVISHPAFNIGAEVRELMLASVFRRFGIDAQVFRITRGKSFVEEHPLGAPIAYHAVDDNELGDDVLTSKALLGSLKWFAPDIIVLKGFGYQSNLDIAELLDGELSGCKLIGVLGGRWRDDSLKRCKAVFFEFASQEAGFANFTQGAVIKDVLPKAMNWLFIDKLLKEGANKRFDVVGIGSLIKRKQYHKMLELDGAVSALVIGDGPLKQELQDLAADRPNVQFSGSMDNEDALRAIHQSRVFLHFAEDEGLPRVFGEALACGVPIVCSNKLQCGRDFPEGLLFQGPTDDLARLAKTILDDQDVLDEVSKAGPAFMKRESSFKTIFGLFCRAVKRLDETAELLLP